MYIKLLDLSIYNFYFICFYILIVKVKDSTLWVISLYNFFIIILFLVIQVVAVHFEI